MEGVSGLVQHTRASKYTSIPKAARAIILYPILIDYYVGFSMFWLLLLSAKLSPFLFVNFVVGVVLVSPLSKISRRAKSVIDNCVV